MIRVAEEAKQLFTALKEEQGRVTVADLTREGWDQSSVMRAALWLDEEGLATVDEDVTEDVVLTRKGEDVAENGLPERILLDKVVDSPVKIADIAMDNLHVAIGKAMENNWIRVDEHDGEKTLHVTEHGLAAAEEKGLQESLEELKAGRLSKDEAEPFIDRGLAETRETKKRIITLTDKGRDTNRNQVKVGFRPDIPVDDALLGRKHFRREILDRIRRIWIDLGFTENTGPLVVPSLLNFDALYTPQDHPARELHDTFFTTPGQANLEQFGEVVDRIRDTHETGWDTGSTGWGSDWEEEEAARNVLRTHTTAESARVLTQVSEEDLPVKYFWVGRVFRNETIDWKHLAEFYQTEGIVAGHNVNFTHLQGYLNQFFHRLGFDNVRFRPAYYPYTEISIEVDVYDEDQEEWMGLGGAGMFRPEVVKPLLGVEVPVLAWGLGPDRLIMKMYDLADMRKLQDNELDLMRGMERGWTAWQS